MTEDIVCKDSGETFIKSVRLYNERYADGLVLDIKETNCIYCGEAIATGEVFLVFPVDLLYDRSSSIEKTARLSHGACLSPNGVWHNNHIMAALELGKVLDPGDLPAQVMVNKVDAKEPVPCGTKRGTVDMLEGIEVDDELQHG